MVICFLFYFRSPANENITLRANARDCIIVGIVVVKDMETQFVCDATILLNSKK